MTSKNSGRSTSTWRRLKAAQRAKLLPCWLCGQPINYDLAWPDPQSFSADHDKPHSRHPELREDPANLRSTHLLCNQIKGAREHSAVVLGSLSDSF